MARHDLRGSSLGGSRLGSTRLGGRGPDDPMASLGNLMDAMLVFACGLLLALVAHWGIDITSEDSSSGAPTVTELEGDLTETEASAEDVGSEYTEVGTVYRDDETGELYVVS